MPSSKLDPVYGKAFQDLRVTRALTKKENHMPEQIDIAAQLSILVKLQEIDTEIYRLKNEKEKKPQELSRLEAEFKEKFAVVKKAEEKFTVVQLKKKDKEGALAAKEDGIKKLQSQLFQIKTNKEYSVMQHEIEGQKADKSSIEDEILLLMEEIDKAKSDITKEKELLVKEEAAFKDRQNQVKLELEEIEKKLEQARKARQSVLPQVNTSVLKKYERILAGKNGLAIVPVKEDACQGCHMNLPPQVIHEIRMNQEFIICENCTRFLYINDDAG